MRTGAVLVLSMSLFGCAAVFRGSKDTVVVESSPAGAEARKGEHKLGVTPMAFDADRKGVTQLTLTKSGYEEHHGIVNKKMNGAWLTLDIVTCPVTICIPLIVDAVTGAWYDVDDKYVASMTPSTPAVPTHVPLVSAIPIAPAAPTAPTASGPPVDMSESERKATARAAYMEGIALQDKGGCPNALGRFETAQKFYSAPTHLLHIGQCQAAIGKLVESAETYETLARTPLTKESPDAFHQAQEEGRKELARIKPRIPTLRLQTIPAPSSLSGLVVKMNGNAIPNELLGIVRPVNPGTYKVTVWAAGYREATQTVDIGEGAAKAVELKLAK
ncbi:MAG TPA: PEGA domain-containing protein [Labilithrix sp.]|nr:PEGA domain-containing protein [Labilithrix sp.]